MIDRFGKHPSPRSCLRALHRLDFVWKRPKRRLLKAAAAKREAFVDQYRTLVTETEARGGRILFVDAAHFRADGDLRGLWVHRGAEALPETALTAAWSDGQAMTVAEAVAYALGETPEFEVRASEESRWERTSVDGLTEREAAVLRMITRGKGNKAIALELSVSVRTVEHHITSLYQKINVQSKAEATAYALRHRLVGPAE